MSYELFIGVFLLGTCLLYLVHKAVFRDGFRTWLSLPFITLMGCTLLYVFDYLRMPVDARDLFISAKNYASLILFMGLFVSLTLLGDLFGTSFAKRKLARASLHGQKPDSKRFYLRLGIALFLIGSLAMAAFISTSGGFTVKYSAVHGSASNFSTAYLYRLPISLYTACFILLVSKFKFKNVPLAVLLVIAACLAFLLFDAVTQGKRGDLIRYALLIIIPLFLFGHLRKTRQVPAILAIGCLALFLNYAPYLRQATSLGTLGNFDQVLKSLPDVTDKSREARIRISQEGKHVVFASNALAGAVEYNQPNYGYRWMFPFINLVPRAIWPDKPSRYDMGYTTYDMLADDSPFSMPSGSHTGGMVESFIEWGYFVLPIWFLFGLTGGYLLETSTRSRSIHSCVLLFGFYNFYVHFLLQDTVAGILFLMYSLGPYFALRLILSLAPTRKPYRPLRARHSNVRRTTRKI